ncbi:MAG: EamA family transporter [Tepidamorphaceae bacterium]
MRHYRRRLCPAAAAHALGTGDVRRVPPRDERGDILGVALMASVLAYSSFQYGVKVQGPSVAGIFMYLLPVYGVSMAVIFLASNYRPFT